PGDEPARVAGYRTPQLRRAFGERASVTETRLHEFVQLIPQQVRRRTFELRADDDRPIDDGHLVGVESVEGRDDRRGLDTGDQRITRRTHSRPPEDRSCCQTRRTRL